METQKSYFEQNYGTTRKQIKVTVSLDFVNTCCYVIYYLYVAIRQT